MKYILIILPIFVFSFDLFGNNVVPLNPDNSKVTQLNNQLIKISQQNSIIMREYTSCMQKARGSKDSRICYNKKRYDMARVKYQKQQVYRALKAERFQNQRKVMANYAKHAKFSEESKPEVEKPQQRNGDL